MTGGSARSQGSGPSSNNARSSLVKDFLFSGSRRLSSSALHLSVFHGSATRSHDNVTVAPQTESTFIDHDSPPNMTFLTQEMDPPGRLRTSSLTMDMSNHNRKDMDSGNSSLIDSSSADSYQEFGSGSRSRTTSSSKSDQSLTSLNQNEYQMGYHRKRPLSISDSNSGSSGKVSLNASDLTETSEEISVAGENKGSCAASSKMYVCEDRNREAESQPFLYLPSADSYTDAQFESDSDIHDSASLGGFEDDCSEYPSSRCALAFSSAVVRGNTNSGAIEPCLATRTRRFFMGSSAREREPLLVDYNTIYEKKACVLKMFHPEPSELSLRRSVSLGNISNLFPDSLDEPPIPEEFYLTSSKSPSPALNPDSHIAVTIPCRPNRRAAPHMHSFSLANTQPNISSNPHPLLKEDSSHFAASPQLSEACDRYTQSHPNYTLIGTHQSPPQPQQILTDPHDKLCSNHGCPCKSSFTPKSQHGHSAHADLSPQTIQPDTSNPAQTAHDAQHQGNCFTQNCSLLSSPFPDAPDAANSTSKLQVQNLESVLGHGAPASVSVYKRGFKRGFKPLKSAGHKPLQVLVPRVKMADEEAAQTYVTTEPCLDKPFLDNDDLHLRQNPHIAKTQSTKTYSHCCIPFTSFPNTLSALPPLASTFEDNFKSPSSSFPLDNQLDLFFGSGGSENYRQSCNEHSFGEGQQLTLVHGGHTEEGLAGTTDHASCGRSFMRPRSRLHPTASSDQLNQPEVVHSLLNRDCGSEPFSSRANSSTRDPRPAESTRHSSPTIPSRCSSQPKLYSARNSHLQTHVHHFHVSSQLSPTLQVPTTIYDGHEELAVQHSCNNLVGRPCHPCHLKGAGCQDIPMEEETVVQAPTDDIGYQGNMTLQVPMDCFVADILVSQHNVDDTKEEGNMQSDSSVIGGDRSRGEGGSLQRSNTSRMALLKSMPASAGHCDRGIRELPDYTYLCLVAALLNPVLGLVAYLCNHYARSNMRMRRPTKANNFYFATIVISTLAIFLTLIGGALLIAHTIVLRSEQKETLMTSALKCQDSLNGADETFQKFFSIDTSIYCDVMRNKKIVDALQRYYLVNTHFMNVDSNKSESNVTGNISSAGDGVGANSGKEYGDLKQFKGEDTLGEASVNETDADSFEVGSELLYRGFGGNSSEEAGGFLPLPKNEAIMNDASKNDASKNDTSKNDASKNDASDASKNDASKNDASKSDASDASKNDASKNDASKNDATKNDASKNDTSKNDASKNDASKNDASKNDASKNDASKNDASKSDASKNDASKNDASDASKNEASKSDASKNDASKNDASKKDASKNDASDASKNDTSKNDAF